MTTRCPNNLIRTRLVSIPRSGHHLLVRGLTEALDHKLVYSENYTVAHHLDNCPFVNLEKSHDFELQEPADPDLNYIILTRDFIPSMLSWYRASPEGTFNEFCRSKWEYYNGFLTKWRGIGLHLEYDLLVLDKMGAVRRCTDHMGGEMNLDKAKLWAKRELV